MRAYTVDVAATALDVERKFLDNLLSHHDIPGCVGGRQGVRRRITREGMSVLALMVTLVRGLGIPGARAVSVARDLHADGGVQVSPTLHVALDRGLLERDLERRLASAVESAREPRRGRPPARPRRGASGSDPA